jgi:CubicO group peptidase (beta-lactamase class C family)
MEESIAAAAERAIAERVFPGCVVGVVRADGRQFVLPFGRYTYEPDAPVVTADTIYDTASLTKSIPTASLALQLIEEGRLALDDRLMTYLPEFRNAQRDAVLIKHLLTYTLDGYGFASTAAQVLGKTVPEVTKDDVLHILLTHDFERPPGSVFKYSNIPAALLGLVVEAVADQTLDVLAQERFFGPLGMSHSTFHPERLPLLDIVPTERTEWRGLVHGTVHDESAFICAREGKVMGHAGLFSTAPDILRFLAMLLRGGEVDGKRFFTRATINQMGTNQIPELGASTGLGWELNQPRYMGDACTPHTFGKTGFTGTLCVCDMEKRVGFVILSNRIHPERPADSSAINRFRKEIGEVVLGSLG